VYGNWLSGLSGLLLGYLVGIVLEGTESMIIELQDRVHQLHQSTETIPSNPTPSPPKLQKKGS
jgi:hypothetical protein